MHIKHIGHYVYFNLNYVRLGMMTYMFNVYRDLYARLVVTYIPNEM